MSNINFGRSYMLRAGPPGREGFQIDGRPSQKTPLHISFSLEKADNSSLNTAKVMLWNLKKESRHALEEKDCMIILSAGYGNNLALILQGNVTSSVTTEDGANKLTELEVMDGRVAIRDTYVTMSYVGNVNEKVLYDALAVEMGMPVVYSSGCVFRDIPDGYAYVGKACTCLDHLTSNNGKKYSIQNGILQVFVSGEAVGGRGYLLSKDTGLIGHPKRITSSEAELTDGANKTSQSGWEVTYLLNGAVGVNDVVQLESEEARGYFRVKKLVIDGDNLEGDWVCTAQIMEVRADVSGSG